MLLLLPPSETKRDGGGDRALKLDTLRFPSLTPQRKAALGALRALSYDREASIRALKLGPKQHDEIDRNHAILTSPVLPAIDRYTGVLYDALGSATLTGAGRAFAGAHLVIQSALFGPIGALDQIPAYRMSHDSRLPGITLRKLWADAAAAALAQESDLVLDLRSEAYVRLGPAPEGARFVRVVSEGPDGARKALNHFNKKGKGELVRAILEAGIDHGGVGSLLDWAEATGIRLTAGAAGELDLIV